nr:reverse transcriptase domain-containing protein [Tanacetum cinerariifolium]
MSTMANTTPLVTTVIKPATNPRDADATPRVNIQEFCEEYYEDILPIIMDKVHRDQQKDVYTRLDFGEGPRERTREDSHHSSARARATKPEWLKVQDRLRYGDRHVLDRLGHRRQSAFDRLGETYSPSTTKYRPRGMNSRDYPQGRIHPHRLDTSKEDRPKDRERFRSVGESYDDSFSHSYRDGNRSRHMKRRKDNESPLSSVSRSDSSDGRYQRSRTRIPNNVKTYDGTRDPEDHIKIFQAAAQVERWAMPTWCHIFNSTLIGAARVWFDELPPESIDSYKDLKAAFLAYFMQQKKYVKDPVEIHNIKQKDGETIEDFMERFKVETGRMNGAPECMRISGFMHGVNNSELTKRLNEHVPKTMEETMITATAFMRGEAAVASKEKGHTSWKVQDQSKRQNSDKRSDFWGHSREGRGSNRFTPLTRTPKEILAAEAGKFQPPPPMVTPVEKRSSNKFCDFHNDKGHSTDECMQLKKQIEELPEIKSQMVSATTTLTGFSGETIWPLGKLRLLLIIGYANHSTRAWMNFMIVRSLSPHNGIIGRLGIRAIQAVPSTIHGMLKFPVEWGIVTIRSSILIPTECTSVITSSAVSKEERTRPDNFKDVLHPDFPDHEVAIGGMLSDKGLTAMCSILKKNLEIFSWQPSDMTGVPRGQAPERAKAIQAKVQKLVEAGIMREVYYHDWLSNPVMVKKHDGSWRMCVDYMDLNKACPQDCYPLLEIDWKVESLCGYPFKCFLDAYKGYHQIQLAEPDKEKSAFHTGQGVYCYTKMPFGIKNAGATYRRLMDKAFKSQIGQNIEVYVDDLVVKSYTKAELMRDIEETFRTLRKINMKLNPKKCAFGLAEGVFLGYVVTLEGIKPCPDKTVAVLQLPSPRTIKETAEAKQAFKQLKQHLSELPLLVAPKPKEELIIYLSATYGYISAVLMTERGATQTPIYFISCTLQGPELNYTPMEKLVLSLVFAAKRLQWYFQAHHITVITDQPIKQIMSRPDVAGRLQKWSIMLGEHNITYRPRTSVKGQILTDFLIEMSGENSTRAVDTFHRQLIMCGRVRRRAYTDKPRRNRIYLALRFQFAASNNEGEYEALIVGLRITGRMGVKNVHVSVDSKLVANQVLGTYVAKEDNMVKYLGKVKSLVSGFTNFLISQVPRSKNKKADALSKIASTSFAHLFKHVLLEVLKDKSIKEKDVATVVEEDGPTWMIPIVEYLKEGTLPEDKKEERKLRIKARRYELMEGILYRRSFLTPWLRCVGQLQAEYVIREIHEGSCSMHAGPRSVVPKAIRLGYYWPTMHRDTRDMIRKCNDCQIHRPITRSPQQPLTPIMAPWPFYKWGIDIAGPFPEGPGKVKFLIVTMDYFTKWIEAKVVATITRGQVKKFVWDNIVYRFGLPGEIFSDNGKQFSDNPFKDWCDKLNITQRFASVKHPQSNGLVERVNRSLGEGIKARLGTEAVIPTEIGMPTYHIAVVDVVSDDEELRLNLDLLEERREHAAICEAKAKSKMMRYYNARVCDVTFRPGDFVYRSNDASHAVAGGKLGPKWEGPYEVTEALGDGAYKLRSINGTILPRTWNIANLKRCYL